MSLVPKCSFRLIGLTEEQVSELIGKHLNDNEYRRGGDHRDKSKKLLRLILNEHISGELLACLLKDAPRNIYYDFFVSVSSDEQSAVIEIPEYVLKLRENVGGKVCFSFTCV